MIGQATSYAKTSVRAETLNRQTVMSSVNDALNEVPGVVVSEADATGSSVWGTQISMRGFVTNRDTQQIGTTIDGLPNGGSGYGGGSLANRYIDTLDLETVEVSQGTADISSRSNEALGGTLNFLTSDPLQDSRLRFVVGAGDNEARKYYVRYDTGLLGGHTRAWVSASSARVHDWIDGSGKTSNDHIAGKFITELDRWTLTGYLSYNDADEPEYTSVSPKGFATNPDRDNLVGTLTGIPYLDQNYRSGSRALRENTFGYLRAAFDGGNGFKASVAAYGHRMQGRGDWLPPIWRRSAMTVRAAPSRSTSVEKPCTAAATVARSSSSIPTAAPRSAWPTARRGWASPPNTIRTATPATCWARSRIATRTTTTTAWV